MKKIAYLFVAFAFFGVLALSSCKSNSAPATTTTDTAKVVTAPAATPDTAATDTAKVVN